MLLRGVQGADCTELRVGKMQAEPAQPQSGNGVAVGPPSPRLWCGAVQFALLLQGCIGAL